MSAPAAFALEFSGDPVPCDFPGCTLDAFHDGNHVFAPKPRPQPKLPPKTTHFEVLRPSHQYSELAARALAAGVPVKIRKGVEYLYVNDATFEYLTAGPKPYDVPLLCRCSQRPYPHELKVHFLLRESPGTYVVWDGKYESRVRFAEKEMRWPWSLCLSARLEPSAERKEAQ